MVREAEKHADADRQRKVSGVKVYVNIQYICTSYGENIWSLFFREGEAVGIWTLVVSQRNFD